MIVAVQWKSAMNNPERRHWISRKSLRAASAALTLAVVLVLGVVMAQAETFSVLYNFAGPPDGVQPYAGLVRDAAGNLYGTTISGGISDYGTVFKVNKAGKETVLHRFTGGSSDGCSPYGGLLLDLEGTCTAPRMGAALPTSGQCLS